MIVSNPRLSKQLKNKSVEKLHQNVIYLVFVLVGFFFWGGGGGGAEVSINLKFVFSGSSLVYSKKYGLKKSEGQKKTHSILI